MDCLHCQAKLRQGTAPFSIDRNGYHLSWDDLPAWICDQCGESLFETAEVDKIQAILSMLDRETAAIKSQLPQPSRR